MSPMKASAIDGYERGLIVFLLIASVNNVLWGSQFTGKLEIDELFSLYDLYPAVERIDDNMFYTDSMVVVIKRQRVSMPLVLIGVAGIIFSCRNLSK